MRDGTRTGMRLISCLRILDLRFDLISLGSKCSCKLGVLQPSTAFEDPIVPIMTHSACRKFYGNGSEPRLISESSAVDKARVQASMTTVTASRVGKEKVRPAPQPYKSPREAVEAARDPSCDGMDVKDHLWNNRLTATLPTGGPQGSNDTTHAASAREELMQGLEAECWVWRKGYWLSREAALRQTERSGLWSKTISACVSATARFWVTNDHCVRSTQDVQQQQMVFEGEWLMRWPYTRDEGNMTTVEVVNVPRD